MSELRSGAGVAERDIPEVTLAVVFLDVVESVRLQQADAISFAHYWSDIVAETTTKLCPLFQAQFVKSLGDGMMLTARTGGDAVRLAGAVAAVVERENAKRAKEQRIYLHGGIDIGPLLLSGDDIYGHPANIAARLSGLARPGQIVVSERVRLILPPEFDAELIDLGECHLRNVAGTVRAHAIGRPVSGSVLPLLIPETALRPVIAVIPPVDKIGNGGLSVLGDAFADEVITELSHVSALNVISRLSTRRLAVVAGDVITASRELLTADYVLSGRVRSEHGVTHIALELCDARHGNILWTENLETRIEALFDGQRDAARAVAERVVRSVLRAELETSRGASLATLANYTLLLSGIGAMYSLGQDEFYRALELLEALGERASRQATPSVWLAKWHVMKIVQGWSTDRAGDTARAMDLTSRALDVDPENALALTIQGLIQTNLHRRFDLGLECFDAALDINPNEPLAWLIRGALYSFTDQGEKAVRDTNQARALSPLDPHRFYKLALAAGAHLTAGLDDEALALAKASLKANRRHVSTLRILAVAQWRLGQAEEARATVRQLLALAPDFTLRQYRDTAPSSGYRIGQDVARVLGEAGVPA